MRLAFAITIWSFISPAQCLGMDRAADFTIRAAVSEALEGGPVVVKVTLEYRGGQDLNVSVRNKIGKVDVYPPLGWEGRIRTSVSIGARYSVSTISPGEEWTETLFLHRQFDHISQGRVRLKLTWRLYSPRAEEILLAEPTTTLDLDIPPATAERLAALRSRLVQRTDEPNLTEEEGEHLAKMILHTRHASLRPVAWRMLETRPDLFPTWELLHYLNDSPESSPEMHPRFVKLACGPHWQVKHHVFDLWRSRDTVLTVQQVRELQSAENIWTSVLAYTTFPKQHDATATGALFARLRALNEPLPAADFTRLLRRLDDDSFEVREKASAELEALGERVEGQLQRCLTDSLPAEVTRRARLALETIRSRGLSKECRQTILSLAFNETAEARQILEALARGSSDTRLRQEVQTIRDFAKKFTEPRAAPSP